jgi:predicted PurR-regulated permease PerM
METLSFILGIALVVVIAIAIVAVYAFVKVGKLENQIRNFDGREVNIYNSMSSQTDWMNKRIDETERNINDLGKEVFSQLDSRLDKLENKLINNNK